MPTANSDVHMLSGLQEAYDSMQSHDTNTLYFCTDTQRYFIGDVEYSRPVQHGTSLPSTYLPPNSLFYNTNTRQLFFSKDGASWQVISSIPSINGVELNGDLTSSDLDIEPARFVVNVTPSGSSFTADRTYEELVEAYNEGRTLQAVVSGITLNLAQFLSGVRFEFSFTDLQYMEYAILRISASNAITLTVTDRVATPSQIGGVLVANYNEDTHSSQRIAMDSSRYLHAPKTSINGVELTNSTTAEDLSLQRAGMVITVTSSHLDEDHPSITHYTSDTTFQQIQDFHTSYPEADIVCQTNTGMKYNLFGINSSSVLFTRDSLQSLSTASITINSDDIVIGETTSLRASSSRLGGVYALDYNESDYSSTQIAIDSSGFLHSPKLSINGKELTNSTTAEELNLKRADFVVNVTQSGSSYIADKTFEEINAAIDSGSDCICYFTLYGNIAKIPYAGVSASSIVFQEYFPASGMLEQIYIDNTNAVRYTSNILFASLRTPGLVHADSDTYDETYTKECKMNHADGRLYCQPTMWSFWD